MCYLGGVNEHLLGGKLCFLEGCDDMVGGLFPTSCCICLPLFFQTLCNVLRCMSWPKPCFACLTAVSCKASNSGIQDRQHFTYLSSMNEYNLCC